MGSLHINMFTEDHTYSMYKQYLDMQMYTEKRDLPYWTEYIQLIVAVLTNVTIFDFVCFQTAV